jgi:preprotein translocase subunit YajC
MQNAPASPAPAAAPNVSSQVVGLPSTTTTTTTTTVPGTTATGENRPLGQPAQQGGGLGMLLPMLLITGFLVLMIVMQTFAGRKEKKRRDEMLSSLARNDKVLTSGGIVGSISELHDQEIVLTTDASSNTRIRVVKSAVQSVLSRSSAAPAKS